MAAARRERDDPSEEVNPMRQYRWTLVPLAFVALALLVAALSAVVGSPR